MTAVFESIKLGSPQLLTPSLFLGKNHADILMWQNAVGDNSTEILYKVEEHKDELEVFTEFMNVLNQN
jgi:hypothetical protein